MPKAPADSDAVTDRCARILAAVAAIPRGSVAGYGEVAAAAGLRGRARMVAWALKQAPKSARIPWHRVLRSDGRIAFPEGSASYLEQCRKLAREGVKVVNGRVARASARGEKDMDALLWGPPGK